MGIHPFSACLSLGNTAQLHLRPSPDIFCRSVGSKSLKYTKYSCTFQTLARQKISRRMPSLNDAVLPLLYTFFPEMKEPQKDFACYSGRNPVE